MDQQPPRRIDKGIKRGPRERQGELVKLERRHGLLPRDGAERDQAIAKALQAYIQGMTLTEIAEQYKVSKQAIRAWLLSEVPEQYHAAQTAGLLQRIAEADEGIDYAMEHRDPIVLACAREQGRFARMDLERRRPHLYGQKQEVVIDHRVSIDAALQESARALLNKVRGEKLVNELGFDDESVDQE